MSYLRKRINAFKYAGRGIAHLFRHEAHAKIHLIVMCLVILAGFFFHITPSEWCAVILCFGGVLSAEGFNTAIEALADKVSPQKDPLIRIAKDVAAGAVLLFTLAAIAIGLIIFLPHLLP